MLVQIQCVCIQQENRTACTTTWTVDCCIHLRKIIFGSSLNPLIIKLWFDSNSLFCYIPNHHSRYSGTHRQQCSCLQILNNNNFIYLEFSIVEFTKNSKTTFVFVPSCKTAHDFRERECKRVLTRCHLSHFSLYLCIAIYHRKNSAGVKIRIVWPKKNGSKIKPLTKNRDYKHRLRRIWFQSGVTFRFSWGVILYLKKKKPSKFK